MAAKKNKAKPSDLGTGGARKAADAIVNRKKQVEKATKDALGSGGKKKATKPSTPPKGPSSSSYKDYQLQKAKEQLKKKKKK